MKLVEKSYVNGGDEQAQEGALDECDIRVFPMFGDAYRVDVPPQAGGHGGGDRVMLNDLFGAPVDDPLRRAAGFRDGALSMMTGIAANCSLRTEAPVKISALAISLPD